MDRILEKIIKDFVKNNISSEEDFLSLIKENLRGQNEAKFPSNIILRKKYQAMVKAGKISRNKSLEGFLVTKKMRSLSGVAVITVLTKPWPCPGKCLYCPTQEDVPKSYLASEPAVMRAILCGYDPYRQVRARLDALELEGHPTDKIELIVIGGTFSSLPKDYQEWFVGQCFEALNFQFPITNNQSSFNDQISNDSASIVIPAEAGIQTSTNRPDSRQSLSAKVTMDGGDNEEERDSSARPSGKSLGMTREGENDTLSEAKKENESAKHRCVGLTLETRPDYITEEEVRWFRYLGATRVELGVQSVFDEVLGFNKRGHGIKETIEATKLLKDAGLKICYHMMPGLPSSNPKKDLEMFRIIFTDEKFQPDYIKIYPCMVTKGSELYDLWKAGKYKPYSDKQLENLICEIKKIVPYHVRIMRLIRDIPSGDIEAGSKISNLRQNAQRRLAREGLRCKCIRCRESGLNKISNNQFPITNQFSISNEKLKIFRDEYKASGGTEIFLNYESEDRSTLYALLRLRFPNQTYLDELKNCALIRELHTYGQQIKIGKKGETQHKGLGKKLILEAEKIARENGYKRIAVISGVGVRDYYRKFGYKKSGEYMSKNLT